MENLLTDYVNIRRGRIDDMSGDSITGSCLCGDVRFHASAAPRRVTHCHCGMCRRALGAVVATFAAFERRHVDWQGPLARYDSSDTFVEPPSSIAKPARE